MPIFVFVASRDEVEFCTLPRQKHPLGLNYSNILLDAKKGLKIDERNVNFSLSRPSSSLNHTRRSLKINCTNRAPEILTLSTGSPLNGNDRFPWRLK